MGIINKINFRNAFAHAGTAGTTKKFCKILKIHCNVGNPSISSSGVSESQVFRSFSSVAYLTQVLPRALLLFAASRPHKRHMLLTADPKMSPL